MSETPMQNFPKTDLSSFSNPDFDRGVPKWKELLWMIVKALFFQHSLAVLNDFKAGLLRAFGAKVGEGVIIKPNVNIKFPWKLEIGDYCWIGEQAWIDNLEVVKMGNNVCLSQGALLLTGNHDYKKTTFDLTAQPIILEDGVWIGAKSTVCSGVVVRTHAVLAVGSVATKELEAYTIYTGVPAQKVRARVVEKNK